MKKFLAILLSVMLVLAFSTLAFASGDAGGGSSPSYTITVSNPVEGETYSAYKIFDAAGTVSGGVYQHPASGSVYDDTAGITYYTEDDDGVPGTYDVVTGLSNGDDVSDYYVLKSGVSYTIDSVNNPWYSVVNTYAGAANDADGLTLTPSAGDPNVYVVSIDESKFDAKAFAQALKTALDASPSTYAPAADSDTAGSSALTLDVGAPGYYFVDTSLGSLCALDTASTSATVYEKNTEPTVVKKISDTNSNYGAGPVDVDIGDTVYYEITVTDGRGTDTAITVHDTMEPGLTLDPTSFNITVNDTAVPAANYTITVDDDAKVTSVPANPVLSDEINSANDTCTFEIAFTDSYIASLAEDAEIVITYSAVLNADAEIYYGTGDGLANTNDNSVYIAYAQQKSAVSTVSAKTYDFEIIKTDGTNPLQGVTFTLSKTENSAVSYYTPASDTTTSGATTTSSVWTSTETPLSTNANGIIEFKGLDEGTYILTEKTTLDGYNLLTNTITVVVNNDGTITASNTNSTGIQVTSAAQSSGTVTPANFTIVNNQGSTLPSTGGIGTTILYIVGAILVLGAGILIIAKRRSAAAEQ